MDDTCAVCADTLEWVAYGPCLHKEVCSTCIIRLRFICNDFYCCICKSESNTIFVTKALGDYTKMISDFKGLGEVNGSEDHFRQEHFYARMSLPCKKVYCFVTEFELKDGTLAEHQWKKHPFPHFLRLQKAANGDPEMVWEGQVEYNGCSLSRQNMVKVLNSSRTLAAANNHRNSLANSCQILGFVSDLSSFHGNPTTVKESVLSTYTSSPQAGSSRANGLPVSSNFASSSRTSNSNSKPSQSSAAPNPADRTSHKSHSSVPSLSASQGDNMSTSASPVLKSCGGDLTKDGNCGGKGKSKILVGKQANLNLSREIKSEHTAQEAGVSLKKNVGAGGGGNKPRKKQKVLENAQG
uniref:RING-type domain-containing protein n=1 Tax=Salix viminalis TaxID=40686 RepID=A0A6N2K7Z0_SALVM